MQDNAHRHTLFAHSLPPLPEPPRPVAGHKRSSDQERTASARQTSPVPEQVLLDTARGASGRPKPGQRAMRLQKPDPIPISAGPSSSSIADQRGPLRPFVFLRFCFAAAERRCSSVLSPHHLSCPPHRNRLLLERPKNDQKRRRVRQGVRGVGHIALVQLQSPNAENLGGKGATGEIRPPRALC